MYFEMKLRDFTCPDCGRPFKTTSPNAVRCPGCSKDWSKKRNRDYQRRRYVATKRDKDVPRNARRNPARGLNRSVADGATAPRGRAAEPNASDLLKQLRAC